MKALLLITLLALFIFVLSAVDSAWSSDYDSIHGATPAYVSVK